MSLVPASRSPVVPHERRWVLLYASLVMLVISIPYILGYAAQTSSWQFTGFVFGVEDGNSYIAKMLSGEAGSWLFRTPYSTEHQAGVIAFLPYLLLGKLTAPPGLHDQLVALFHLFRVVAGMIAILATYDFIAYFCTSVRLRRIGLVVASLGGGLGWVLILLGKSQWLGSLPLDFYSPETFGFLELYGIPHLSLARAALLWGLLVYLGNSTLVSPKWPSNSIRLGGLWFLAAIAQPITAVVLGFVIAFHLIVTACWQFWRGKKGLQADWRHWRSSLRMVFVAGLIVLPFMIYNVLAFSFDPFLRSWTIQNTILSPHPIHYLLAYGFLLPLAFLGARSLLSRHPWRGSLLAAWVLALPVLAYIPFNLQRRLPDGIWVALVCLAVASMESPGELPQGKGQRAAGPNKAYWWRFIFFLSIPSTLFLIAGGVMAAMRPSLPVFRPASAVRAYQFFAQPSLRGQVVLSSYSTGNAIPAWAAVKVVIGHGPESVGFAELAPRVAGIFEIQTPDSERREFLQEQDVHFVFWGPAERELGAWNPGQAAYLTRVYDQDGYSIFEVAGPQ